MKSEPDVYSIDHLAAEPDQTDYWDGIRNYQVRNFFRDEFSVGDLAFFYHSRCKVPGIVGTIQVVREAYPDTTAFDPAEKYYDPKSDLDNPRWLTQPEQRFSTEEIQQTVQWRRRPVGEYDPEHRRRTHKRRHIRQEVEHAKKCLPAYLLEE